MSEQGVLAFPVTRHGSLVLGSAKRVSSEHQYPCAGHLSTVPNSPVPFPGRGTHGWQGAEHVPHPRWQQMSDKSSRLRIVARAAKCDSSIMPGDRQRHAPSPGTTRAQLAPAHCRQHLPCCCRAAQWELIVQGHNVLEEAGCEPKCTGLYHLAVSVTYPYLSPTCIHHSH